MVMVGSGAMAPNLINAHASVRPIKKVTIWNRNGDKARALAAETAALGFEAVGTDDLEAACKTADLISCATLSTEPLVRGEWLREGTHVDLVGAFKPTMRETDDALMQKCRIYVDSFEGAAAEGGDVVQPLNAGLISKSDILGDLFGLTRGEVKGRETRRNAPFSNPSAIRLKISLRRSRLSMRWGRLANDQCRSFCPGNAGKLSRDGAAGLDRF
jgi:ornithine cyclodeaminase